MLARVAGQTVPSGIMIRGELQSEGLLAANLLTVELVDSVSGRPVASDLVKRGGEFEFRMVTPGNYQVRVSDDAGRVLVSQFASIHDSTTALSIRLPRVQARAATATGTISVERLLHPIPEKAMREFVRSQRDIERGDIHSSIRHLSKAIAIAPGFMEAYNNLGNGYVALKQYEDGIQQFQTAQHLDSSAPFPHVNLSFALFMLKRYPESEAEARIALRLSPHLAKAHYMLGMSLSVRGADGVEAVEHLNASATEFPKARLTAARILLQSGKVKNAAEELQAYLSLPDAAERETVERWLAQLAP
jgi:predicted Zn-dependent protease